MWPFCEQKNRNMPGDIRIIFLEKNQKFAVQRAWDCGVSLLSLNWKTKGLFKDKANAEQYAEELNLEKEILQSEWE